MQLRKKSDSALISLTNSRLETPNSGKDLPHKKRQSLVKVTLGALYLLLIVALPAMACGDFNRDLLASSLFTLPAVSSVSAFGLPLLAIVSIESFILHQRESIPYLKAFGLAALANGFYLVASPVSYAFFTLFPLSLLGSVISASMCLSFCQRTGYLKHLSQGIFTFLVYLLFVGLGFVHLFLMTSMNSSASPAFLYAVTAGLLLIGFIFGFVAKGFAIALGLREKRPSLATTVMSMHVGSFAIIPLAFYIMPPQWWQ
jgi:uncharacterized membrane protein (DUF485 family)